MSEPTNTTEFVVLDRAEREAWAKALCGVHDDWISNDEVRAGYHRLGSILPLLERKIAEAKAEAWLIGHAAGRYYQGDGWNSDDHDPNLDNPYLRDGGGS